MVIEGDFLWFSIRVYLLSLYQKKATTRQQENTRAPLTTSTKEIFPNPGTHRVEVGLNLYTLKWTMTPSTMEHRVPPCACQNFPVTKIAELKSHFKKISLVRGDATRHQKVRQKSHLTLRQWSHTSKGPYDILLLQPVGYSLPMRTHIQDIEEQQSTIKVQQYVPHLYTIDMKLYVQICEIICEVFKRPKMLKEQMFLQLKSRGRRTDGYCPRPCLLRYIQLL